METKKPKVLVIVGPTASGKTSLSIELAQKYNGEVISADSRQVYRGLDLGSGKVTTEEMTGVLHHLLDVADPNQVYTAVDFKRDAAAAILDIEKRGRLPIIAGGTFMYIDTLLGRISLPAVEPNELLRSELEHLSSTELLERLAKLDAARANSIDRDNPRRLIRAIEVATALGNVPQTVTSKPYDVLTLGINISKEELHENIHKRIESRMKIGMLTEVQGLIDKGVTHERLEDLGLEYRYLSRHLRGELNLETALSELEIKTRQFAKRQLTWLKRDQIINWVDKNDWETIDTLVNQFLND